MLSVPARFAVLALVLGLGAVSVSPAQAGCDELRAAATPADPALVLARGVLGQRQCERYAPTGETIDLTVPVVASRF